METVKRKKSKMPCLFGGNGENAKRKAVQSWSSTDGPTDQNLFTFEVGNSYSKQGIGTPMKTLLAKEMSNEISAKKRSPSIIAKLMGLDGLPSPQPIHRQQKKISENSHKRSISLGGQCNEKPFNHQSDKKSTMEQQQFKDVFEDPEASHVANQCYSLHSSAKRRVTKKESAYIREKCDEAVRESKKLTTKIERVDSNSDLMLSFLQQPDSLFVKHLHDQQGTPSSSPCNQITLLKPSNSFRHGVHGKSLKEERETSKYRQSACHQRHEDGFLGYSSRSTNNSYRSSRVQLERKEVTAISPTRIVVLKPNITKIYNDKSTVLSPDDCRTNAEYYSRVTGDGRSQKYMGSLGEVRSSRHKSREAREIAREITSRMKEGFESGHANLFDFGFSGYFGDERLYNMSISVSASESEVPYRNSFDWNDRPKHSPSRMSDSSVIREAKKRMSERWKMTHRYKDVGMGSKGSTLGEMLSVPDREMRIGKFHGEVGLVGVNDESASPRGLGMPLGISSRDGWRDGYLRSTSRSKSLPPSFRNRNHRPGHEVNADEKLVVYSEPFNRGRSKGVKGNFNHEEYLTSRNLRHNKRGQDSQHSNACRPAFPTFLPESHSSQEPTEEHFEDEDPVEQPRLSDIHGVSINAASTVDAVVVNVNNMSSESVIELSPKRATCMLGDANSSAVDEDASNMQESSPAKSGGSVSMQLSGPEPESSESSKEVDQCGQTSVLEVVPTEDVSSGSDCFETVNSQLHELRKQLQLLKMETGSTYDEEVEQTSPFTLLDSDNWESAYLTDILQGSGFCDSNPYTFMATWYAIDCPIDPWLFDHLEKKYSEQTTISRPDRRLLYDRTNEAIFLISKTLVSCSWVSPRSRGVQMTLPEIGFEDQLHKVLTKQEKDATEGFEEMSIDKDLDWFQPVKEIDIVGKQIAELLVNDLVLEVVEV